MVNGAFMVLGYVSPGERGKWLIDVGRHGDIHHDVRDARF